MKRAWTLALVALVSSGCGSNADDEAETTVPGVSPECAQAFADLEQAWDAMYAREAYTEAEAKALDVPTFAACRTAQEYVAGARNHPEALGFSDYEVIDPDFLAGVCRESYSQLRSTQVCQDAIETGLAN